MELEVCDDCSNDDCDCEDGDDYWAIMEDPAHFGKVGNNYNPTWFPKWNAEGQTDLLEVASIYAAMARDMREMAEAGWTISQPVDNGYIFTHWTGEGAPPIETSEFVDGKNAAGVPYGQ